MHKISKTYIITAIIAVILLAGVFYGGMQYGKSRRGNFNFPGQGQNVSIRGNRQAGMNGGEIISKDDKSITIKMASGGSKIIFFSHSTEIGKFTMGTLDDLQIGKTVMVQGQANNDGSITAQSIQIRPASQSGPGQPQ